MASRVLITGASGLIGTHSVAACREAGLDVVALDHRRTDLLDTGQDRAALEAARPETVVHLAWSASGAPGYRDSEDNTRWLEASLALHDACLQQGVRFVGVGTVVDDGAPVDRYSWSKVELRRRLSGPVEAGLVGWLRPHYVFDPERGRPAVVREAAAALAESRPAQLSDPASMHDFVHARDVGTAVATVVRHDLTGVVDVGSGRCRSVAELVERIGVEWRQVPRQGPPVQHDEHAADIRRLGGLGWAPVATEEFFDHG